MSTIPPKQEKIGIFGGTFSPPHLGHRNAAESFFSKAGLDRLLIMPTHIPPHKEIVSSVSDEQRLAMCRLAFADMKNTEISDLEIRRGGKSYTYLTLEELAQKDRELFFLVGTDMFLSLDCWMMPERIFAHAVICCARREDDAENAVKIIEKKQEYEEKFAARILLLHHNAREVSSTELRRAISGNAASVPNLSDTVLDYIRKEKLYLS